MKISMHNLSHGDVALHDVIIPGAPLTNFNDGGGGGGEGEWGSDTGSYFIPKNSQLQNLSSQKNHYFFFYHTQKIP